MIRLMAAMAAVATLGACATAPAAGDRSGRFTIKPTAPSAAAVATGLVGRDAADLSRLLGRPARQFQEGTATKLQFRGPTCVLDAYLYPGSGGTPAVTHVDARLPDGRDTDRGQCVAALQHRR